MFYRPAFDPRLELVLSFVPTFRAKKKLLKISRAKRIVSVIALATSYD